MLLIAAYVRFDVLGLCYLFIAGIFCFLPYRFLENSRIVFALLICAEIIVCLQYFFNLGFPSGVSGTNLTISFVLEFMCFSSLKLFSQLTVLCEVRFLE
jgi:hypothetical protein